MKDGWSKHFRRLGGVKYLEVLILEIDVVKYVGGNLGARCVALLLKIMSYVYTENVSNGKNTIGLVRRVFDLLRTCVLVNERVRSTLRRRTSRSRTYVFRNGGHHQDEGVRQQKDHGVGNCANEV